MIGVTPYLQVKNTEESINWYRKVFAATETRSRLVAPDGTCMNAEINIAGTTIMLADEMPNVGSASPSEIGATTVVLNLHVQDVDAVFERAIREEAKEIFPLADQFYGDRAGRICDPFGHHWIIAAKIKEVSDKEMLEAFQKMFR